MILLELDEHEHELLMLLAGLGLSAFSVPSGPAYSVKERIEERTGKAIETADIENLCVKIKDASKRKKEEQ